MYKLNNKIEQVIDFCEKSNFAIINGKITNLTTNNCIADIEKQRLMFCFGNDYVISKDIRGNSFIIDISNLKIDNRFKIDAVKYPYFTFYEFDKKEKEGIFNYLSKEILFETTEWIGRDIIDNYIFSSYQNIITCRKINNGNILWQFDLSQFGTFYSEQSQQQEAYKVEKFIGIHQDRLYVALNGGVLLEINIATGELTHRWELNKQTRLCSGKQAGIYLLSAFINKEASKIEILSGNSYATINIQSKEVQHFCMQEELNKYNLVEIKSGRQLSFSPIHIFSAVLYFGDGKHIWDGVCAVNRKTHKIDWIFTDKKMALGTNNPKIAGNKLYQLSLNNELYIFEKTSNENI